LTQLQEEAERYLLHKHDKGKPGSSLKLMIDVRSIQLGEKALDEAKRNSDRSQVESLGRKLQKQ
jgi:hypothetical protein